MDINIVVGIIVVIILVVVLRRARKAVAAMKEPVSQLAIPQKLPIPVHQKIKTNLIIRIRQFMKLVV